MTTLELIESNTDINEFIVHALGADAMFDCIDEITALREANNLNKLYSKERDKHQNNDDFPFYIAVVKTRAELGIE